MAQVEKVEFHLTEPGCTDPSDWLDSEAEALAKAGPGWKVERVTYYSADRETIYPAPDGDED